jgi:membrane-associated phospholipid phosphatase
MKYLTDFGDQAVVLPVAAAVLVVLLALGWRRGALAWAVCVAGVLGVMLVLKVITLACGWRVVGWTDLVSPSGHTAASSVVYGGLLALLAPPSIAGTGLAAIAGGAVALLFGLTRLALQVHTVADVTVGAAVGVAGTIAMRRLAGQRPPRVASPLLPAIVLAMMLLFHGDRLEAESHIRWLALDIWPLTLCQSSVSQSSVASRQIRHAPSDD